ncbi:hypothetical protein [Croceicoccus gelatinilyticus]|uniref:hypothetical protein n=1 Tax=Croceicoccus gelatinilyticus TaxID=2835536 RepID=UPI001BD146C4|nr:hypothetical protein [Croceicoccus gelatinilyticus]MBS7668256.1 hypothetical protein [Croceicoccus gelatinilyticus]
MRLPKRNRLFLLAAPLALAACSEEPRDAQVSAPRQGMMDGMPADARGLRKVATFDADVLVLSRRNYGGLFGDTFSDYSPVDLAVAWSEGARAEVHSQISIRQSGRFYYWRAGADAWQDPRVRRFGKHSANWHLIPADDTIADKIDRIGANDVVGLKGYLVDIDAPDGSRWRTSRTRNDKGAGACEIILVTEVRAYDEAA